MIRFLKAGSVPWLLAHEVRMAWRAIDGRSGEKKAGLSGSKAALILLVGVGLLGLVGGGVGLAFLVWQFPVGPSPMAALIVTGAMGAVLTLMLTHAINASVQALYQRGDMDLLLSSPLKPRVVLTVRLVAIAVSTGLLYYLLVTSFVLAAWALGQPHWLTLYGLIAGLTLIATTLGLGLTMALFSLIGPRRTRVVAQITAGVVGASAFLGSQIYNFTRPRNDDQGGNALAELFQSWTASEAFQEGAWGSWALRALLGEALPLILFIGSSLVVFGVTISALARRFTHNAAAAVGDRAGPKPRRVADRAFAAGLTRVMVQKELRLLARDPQLLSQVMLRLLYLLPLGFILFRNAQSGAGVAFGAGAVVIMAGQLAGSFSWITISAEDSPELLRSAPVQQSRVDRAKLYAALIPAMSLTALALAGLAAIAPLATGVVLVGCLAAAASAGLINIWRQKPAQRRDFQKGKKGSILVGIAEFVVGALWAAATGMAVGGMVWAAVPAALAVGFTLMLRRSPEKIAAAAALS
jgi:ABC-2 type transport system permease protein